jgi:hypothetical protein
MSEERFQILQMVSEGQITAQEGAQLLKAPPFQDKETVSVEAESEQVSQGKGRRGRWFNVRVSNLETGCAKVNVRLPLPLVKVGLKIGTHFAPELEGIDWDDLISALQEDGWAKLVKVEDIEDGERVEVYVD